MTREEAKEVFFNRGFIKVNGGTLYDPDKWRDACSVISEWLKEQEPVLDKLRADIVELWQNEPCAIDGGCLDEILEIIDKYKAESEDKE